MRKLHEILRLRFELKLSQHQVARSCSIGQATVCDYLKRAQAAGVTGRCLKAGMMPGWKKPCSGRLHGASMKATDPSPTLPACTKNSKATAI